MRAKKLLRNACKLLKHVFSDKRLNTIACGIASFAAGLWTTAAYLGFAAAATEFAAPFAVPLACIVALPWALTAMVLLNLRERRFKPAAKVWKSAAPNRPKWSILRNWADVWAASSNRQGPPPQQEGRLCGP